MIRECTCGVQVRAHTRSPQRTLFPRDSKAMTMKVGIRLGVCTNPTADLLQCECTRRPVIPHHHNLASSYNKERAAKPVKNGLKWLKMGENGWQFHCATSLMHKKCKNSVMEQQTCEKGPILGFKELPAYKSLHCVRTACTAFPSRHTKVCTACTAFPRNAHYVHIARIFFSCGLYPVAISSTHWF